MREELLARGHRSAMLTKPGVSAASLADALNDPDSVVCATALSELGKRRFPQEEFEKILPGPTKQALENKKEDWFLQTVVAMIHPDRDVLMKLFCAGNWNVRLALANRSDYPEEILNLLATLPVEASGHLRDRFDVIRNIALARSTPPKGPIADEF